MNLIITVPFIYTDILYKCFFTRRVNTCWGKIAIDKWKASDVTLETHSMWVFHTNESEGLKSFVTRAE